MWIYILMPLFQLLKTTGFSFLKNERQREKNEEVTASAVEASACSQMYGHTSLNNVVPLQ